jgi:DNA-binding PadR family transcriptional regulator
MGIKPSHGKIYPFLNELQTMNYISAKENECDLRSKVIYELTADGEKLLESTLGYLESIFSNFLTSCSHCGLTYYSAKSISSAKKNNYCCVHCKTAKVIQEGFEI